MRTNSSKEVIVALDFASVEETFNFLALFTEALYVKVGMELYYQVGPEIIRKLKQLGHKIFLDLKLHDIPNTVKETMRNLGKLDLDLVNVHAMGGIEMMKAALNGLRSTNKNTKCIAVTALTSLSDAVLKRELLINRKLETTVLHYAQNAFNAGLDGVVCSPLEVQLIHRNLGEAFLTVTPGIRLDGDNVDDQVRVTTPVKAKIYGADYIVVGRSITRAIDPVSTYNKIKASFMRGDNDEN